VGRLVGAEGARVREQRDSRGVGRLLVGFVGESDGLMQPYTVCPIRRKNRSHPGPHDNRFNDGAIRTAGVPEGLGGDFNW